MPLSMKKLTTTIIMAAATLMSVAQPPMRQWAEKTSAPEDLYTLTVGQVTMIIDSSKGAKVTSLKYGDKEMLSQMKMPNAWGSTFWTSPQKEWNWPPVREHDALPYTVKHDGDALVMTSQLSQRFPLRIEKRFEADAADDCIVVTYSIINEGDAERSVAPWEITRVPARGSIFFDAPVSGITPAGLMAFVEKNGLAWFDIDHNEKQRKINADGKGWLSYTHDGLLLTKRFQDIDASQPAPDEAEIQVYVHNGDAYVELESQGAYTKLKPGEKLDWAVRWYLTPHSK